MHCPDNVPYNANGEAKAEVTASSALALGDTGLLSLKKEWSNYVLEPSEEVANTILKACADVPLVSGVDWKWLFAISGSESGWLPSNYTSCNDCCCGLFGMAKAYFNSYCNGCNIFNLYDNACGAVRVFNENYKRNAKKGLTGQELILSCVIAHNTGSGAFDDICLITQNHYGSLSIENIKNAIYNSYVKNESKIGFLRGSESKRKEVYDYIPKTISGYNYLIKQWLPKHSSFK